MHHFFKNIAVADFCPHHFTPSRSEGFIQAKIAHHGGHDRILLKPASLQKIQRRNRKNLIAVHNLAVLVAEKNAIGIAVMRNANICAADFHDALDLFRMHAAATVVDIHAIRLVMRHGHVRAQFTQNTRSRFVSRAIRDIHGNSHFLERHAARETRFDKFHVTAERVINSRGASDFVRRRPDGVDLTGENQLLNFFLDLIVELVTVVPEKFDAVVLISIMRSRKDDPGVRA